VHVYGRTWNLAPEGYEAFWYGRPRGGRASGVDSKAWIPMRWPCSPLEIR
jgi:hypothetical protein